MKLLKKTPGRRIWIMINNKETEIDQDFWDYLEDDDLKEAIEEYVRDSNDFSVWVD